MDQENSAGFTNYDKPISDIKARWMRDEACDLLDTTAYVMDERKVKTTFVWH